MLGYILNHKVTLNLFCQVALCTNVLYFITLLCVMPGDFTYSRSPMNGLKTILLNGLIVCILGSGIRSAFIQCLNCGTNRWHCPPVKGIWYKYCLYTISVFWQSIYEQLK